MEFLIQILSRHPDPKFLAVDYKDFFAFDDST